MNRVVSLRLIISFFCSVCVALCLSSAQTPTPEDLFLSFGRMLKTGKGISFSVEIRDSKGAVVERGNGTIWMRDKFFRFFYGDIDQAYDGSLLRIIDKEQQTLTIVDAKKQDLLWTANPLSLLDNPSKSFVFNKLEQSKGGWICSGTLKKEFQKQGGGIESFQVHFSSKNKMPLSITVHWSGAIAHYKILQIKERKTLNVDDFRYKAYETNGLEVIDLR